MVTENDEIYEHYEAVIGLEVHCQLLTASKIFSAAPTAYGAAPNTQVAGVDLGLPGALPVLNRRAVAHAVRAGLALDCRIEKWSQFARKNYFYPDLPKGYQISQHEAPLCTDGHLLVTVSPDDGEPYPRRVGIERIHMEEDAGKSIHPPGAPHSLVDLNRSGVPLIEIVTRPDLRSAQEAAAFLKELHAIVVYLGVSDGNMEEGSFRCDANVSVRPRGSETLGTRTELKNINSFKFVRQAIDFEIRRQIDRVESGEEVRQQTRLYDPERDETFAMRSKEEAHDYRYFPEPDLPPLVLDAQWLGQLADELPELPAAKRRRYREELELGAYDAEVLAADRGVAEYFEAALRADGDAAPKSVANWIINELLRELKGEETLDTLAVEPAQLAQLVALVDDGTISGKIGKKVFEQMLDTGEDPADIIEEQGLRQIADPDALGPIVDQVLDEHPEQVETYRQGNKNVLGYFMGQVMKATRGKAKPDLANRMLRERLEEDDS